MAAWSATIMIMSPALAPIASEIAAISSSEKNFAIGPPSPSSVTGKYARPLALCSCTNSMSLSIWARGRSAQPGAHRPLTTPPFAATPAKTLKPQPSAMLVMSTSGRSKRRSGLSEPYLFMASA